MDAKMLQTIDAFVEENREAMVKHIARLVAVPSVEGAPEEGAPFGAGPARALQEVLAIAEEMGLKTRSCEGYLGYAYIGSEEPGYLATVTHVDVVPPGEGWKADPYVLRQREGYLLGRGVLDDKGPSVLCLYALKFLQETGTALKYPVRALFGANEETGMKDVEYYLERYPAPLFAFSPDADFPLINGEKGVYHATMKSRHLQQGNILAISGGLAVNVIPAKASAVVKVAPEKAGCMDSTEWVEAVQTAEDIWQLTARGIGGHASVPSGTVNAIGKLIEYILERDLASRKETAFLRFALKAHSTTDGSALGIAADDGKFTPLTAVSGMIYQEEDRLVQSLDVRYPTNIDGDTITQRLRDCAAGAALIEADRVARPFWRDPDSPELSACIEAYREITGDREAKAFSIGGGTYAKDFPNAVAFGPEHADRKRPDFVGYIHGAEEAGSLAELEEALKVYITALLKLQQLDF